MNTLPFDKQDEIRECVDGVFHGARNGEHAQGEKQASPPRQTPETGPSRDIRVEHLLQCAAGSACWG